MYAHILSITSHWFPLVRIEIQANFIKFLPSMDFFPEQSDSKSKNIDMKCLKDKAVQIPTQRTWIPPSAGLSCDWNQIACPVGCPAAKRE